jgi:hypothetical protein
VKASLEHQESFCLQVRRVVEAIQPSVIAFSFALDAVIVRKQTVISVVQLLLVDPTRSRSSS